MRSELGSVRAEKSWRTSFGDNQSLWFSLEGMVVFVEKDGFWVWGFVAKERERRVFKIEYWIWVLVLVLV